MKSCKACSGSGVSSKGGPCHPCRGTGKGPWISPTTKLAGACELSQVLTKTCGVRRNPQREATLALGREVHAHIERAIKGLPVPSETDSGAVAMHALPIVAGLPIDAITEHRMLVDCGDYGIDATADVLIDSACRIIDWKTSKDPRRYGHTAESLRVDPQALALAFGAVATRGWHEVNLQWEGLPTRTDRKPKTVHAHFTPEQILGALPDLDAKIRRRLSILENPFQPLTAAFGECHKYSGCDHLAYCPAKQSLSGAIRTDGEITMSIDPAVLEALKVAAGGSPQQAAPPPTTASGGLDVAALMAQLQGQAAPAAPAAAPVAPPVAPAGGLDVAALLARAGLGASAAPAAPAPAAPVPAAPAPAPGAKKITTLYLDCLPLGGQQWTDAATILQEVNGLVQRDASIAHYALAEYGKGAALVAIAVNDCMTRFAGGAVVCVRQPQALVDALRTHAASVVMGVR